MTEQPAEHPEVTNPGAKALEIEMAYTSWDASCQDPHITFDDELRQCRRPKGHKLPHASGFASTRTLRIWT